jgi:hypothetical protein
MNRFIYRDTTTGRFASKQTWKRSKAQGGKRYKREKLKRKRKFIPPPPPKEEVSEWIISFEYDKSGRSFDLIVTARDQSEAFKVAKLFLEKDRRGKNIYRAEFKGWSQSAAKGEVTNEKEGKAEYREDSEAEEV